MNVVYTASVDNLRAFARFATRGRFPLYRKLQRERQPAIVRVAMYSIFLSPILLIAGGVQLVMQRYILGLFPLAMGALYTVLIVWFLLPPNRRRRQEQQWAKHPNIGKPVTVEVDEAGLHFLEATIDRHVEWSAIVEIEESPTHLFVIDTQPLAYIIPKEAVTSPADAEAFGLYVRSHATTQSA